MEGGRGYGVGRGEGGSIWGFGGARRVAIVGYRDGGGCLLVNLCCSMAEIAEW
jgi:hypothetical protein